MIEVLKKRVYTSLLVIILLSQNIVTFYYLLNRDSLDNRAPMAVSKGLVSVEFEVFGKVQGVFFRKHTQATAKKLGLVGWVQNTARGTVVGSLEGPADKVSQMKKWLQETGSPKSRIEKCAFDGEKKISSKSSQLFLIRK